MQWLYRLRPTRPDMLAAGPTEDEQRIVGAHFERLQALAADGVVQLAGRTLTDDETTFGVVILTAPDEATARLLMASDPAVAGGVMSAELFPFRIAVWSAPAP